mmetsp:Transcript_34756/g.102162  ORF Transcript_34756/g.102162 Transcript_34756/m.102162 type:complete len:207 (+) Transcript_34756:1233-1853(+)
MCSYENGVSRTFGNSLRGHAMPTEKATLDTDCRFWIQKILIWCMPCRWQRTRPTRRQRMAVMAVMKNLYRLFVVSHQAYLVVPRIIRMCSMSMVWRVSIGKLLDHGSMPFCSAAHRGAEHVDRSNPSTSRLREKLRQYWKKGARRQQVIAKSKKERSLLLKLIRRGRTASSSRDIWTSRLCQLLFYSSRASCMANHFRYLACHRKS